MNLKKQFLKETKNKDIDYVEMLEKYIMCGSKIKLIHPTTAVI
jgi:hypothetical protein